jgi:urea transport system ATP-binding protein
LEKTTALKAIVGLLPVDAGAIFFSGKEITTRAPEVRASWRESDMCRRGAKFFRTDRRGDLQLGALANRSRQASKSRARVSRCFRCWQNFGVAKAELFPAANNNSSPLRRALMSDPSLLILDEPTEGIQPNIIDLIGETIASLRQQRTMGILLVEQYLDFARELADFFYIMDRGMIVQRGKRRGTERRGRPGAPHGVSEFDHG